MFVMGLGDINVMFVMSIKIRIKTTKLRHFSIQDLTIINKQNEFNDLTCAQLFLSAIDFSRYAGDVG